MTQEQTRRQFLGRLTLGAGAFAFSGAFAGLAPVDLLAASACVAPAGSPGGLDPCGDWQLDDICLAYPPYAFRTGSAVPHTIGTVDGGADWHWVA